MSAYTLHWPREVPASWQASFVRACAEVFGIEATWTDSRTTKLDGETAAVNDLAAMYRAAGAMLRVPTARVGEA